MANRYSYIFGGHAVVAEIHRPEEECGRILGSTALPVTGGCAKAEVGPQEWEIPNRGRNSFQSGSSSVSGVFKIRGTQSNAKTITAASLNGLNVVGRVSVEALSVELRSETSSEKDELKFTFGSANADAGTQGGGLVIQGLRVDGVPVRVEFDRSALHVSLERLREIFHPLMTRTIVKLSFPRDQSPQSDVSIEHDNIIRIGDLRIHFGELLIGHAYRNVSLFRLTVGDDQRNLDDGPNVASGPSGYPP